MTDIILNPAARLDLRRTGREGHPLLVIDHLLAHPEDLITAACEAEFAPPQGTRYPGLNAPLPDAYLHKVSTALRPMLQKAFGLPAQRELTMFGFFALATQAPDELAEIQKIPHQDSPDPFRIALVHYLSHPCENGPPGGTAFFRHRATGFEGIDFERRPAYAAAAAAELQRASASLNRHVNEDTPNFELTDRVDLVFNRLIVYRSHVLHSGLLEGALLSADPRQGRLTANSFLEIRRS